MPVNMRLSFTTVITIRRSSYRARNCHRFRCKSCFCLDVEVSFVSCFAQVPVVAAMVEDDQVEHSWQQATQPTASAPPQQLMSDVPLAPAEQVRGPGMSVAAGLCDHTGPTPAAPARMMPQVHLDSPQC